MEDVSKEAGVSRALLYRHFPSKQALFAAVYQQAADQLLTETQFDPADSLVEQLVQGLDVHLDYFVANRHAVLAANRVLMRRPGDPDDHDERTGRTPGTTAGRTPLADETAHEAVSGVLKSWLVFVQVLCVDWLTDATCTRTQLRDVCIGGVLGALRPLLTEDPAPDWPRQPPGAGAPDPPRHHA